MMKAGEAPRRGTDIPAEDGDHVGPHTASSTLEDSGEMEGRPWGGWARGGEARRVPFSAAGGPGA